MEAQPSSQSSRNKVLVIAAKDCTKLDLKFFCSCQISLSFFPLCYWFSSVIKNSVLLLSWTLKNQAGNIDTYVTVERIMVSFQNAIWVRYITRNIKLRWDFQMLNAQCSDLLINDYGMLMSTCYFLSFSSAKFSGNPV